ncbi:histidine phosphatase family protein [Labrys monachus]|uniref:Phosphoglycerate mutase n=1 Tax=Labrys monachus TaxID=217067 RepID=A0ABU0FAT5_9HYPH|nr:histidine phosphatase family protein [Labrys monachus]MDQ0391732.1 putative phosphoglycerate mutase [Labrys monachus]
MAPTLYFIRHGETDWNVDARLQGQRDIPINAKGRVQAAEAGRRLATILPEPDSLPWIVSPMSRTRETAEIARAAIGLPPERYGMDDRLKELTFGEWEGKTWQDLRAVDAPAVATRFRSKWDFVPPDGESYAMLRDRIAGWLQTVGQDTVVVSHGGVARVLCVLRAGLAEADAADADIWQGRLLVFRGDTAEWI